MASSTKQKNRKPMHQKVKLFRAKEPQLSVFMWGINHSINELKLIKIPAMLMPDDFKAYSKVRVDNHLFNKENMPSHFKFKEYCPIVFRNLRERFGIDDQDYMNSLSKRPPQDSDSPGRSGARFLLSYDKMFVIKTISGEEIAEMHHILEQYHKHIVEHRAETLLPQYLGMYRMTVNDAETYVVVMRNIFSPRLSVHKKYDLKGSTVARNASDKEKQKDLPTFKDNDFVEEGMKIIVGQDSKAKFLRTLENDVQLLSQLNLMDYSLLVGIHDIDKAREELEESLEEENGFDEDEDSAPEAGTPGGLTPPDSPVCVTQAPFAGQIDPSLEMFAVKCGDDCPRNEIYFMALIDILTHYGMKKRTAQAAKTMKHGAGAEISTVKPEQYAKRFLEFIQTIVV